MISALALLAASVLADDPTPTTRPYHVYEIPAPARSGIYRLRLSDEAARLWEIEQIQTASMFDNNGQRLNCELLRFSRYGVTTKTHPLTGEWHDLEKDSAPVRGNYGPLNFAWRFSIPTLAENENISDLRFEWRSKVGNPGEVRFVGIPPRNNPYQPPAGTHLMDGQSDPAHGHVNLPFYTPNGAPAQPAPAEAQLLFTLSQDELTIESPVIETYTKKPWTLLPAGGPGWILFAANGSAPYRLQLGETLYGCSQGLGNNVDEAAAVSDPSWPPELMIGTEIANAPHLGETDAIWRQRVEASRTQRINEKALDDWLAWGFFVGIGFIAALFATLLLSKR